MNCPAHCLIYGTRAPLLPRPAESASPTSAGCTATSAPGVVTGLTRVRSFSQDDAHIFCTPEQIEPEITALFRLMFRGLRHLRLPARSAIYLSTRPEKAIGDAGAVGARRGACSSSCLEARGGRATPSTPATAPSTARRSTSWSRTRIGREWQLGTIQLDFNLPERFDLTYVGADGTEQRPVMIHRAILGSLERFFGVMLEHFAGDLPLWLAPEQARVLPVIATGALDAARRCAATLAAAGLRAEVDERNEKLGSKIRDGEIERSRYLLVVGQREAGVRHRRRCACATAATRGVPAPRTTVRRTHRRTRVESCVPRA